MKRVVFVLLVLIMFSACSSINETATSPSNSDKKIHQDTNIQERKDEPIRSPLRNQVRPEYDLMIISEGGYGETCLKVSGTVTNVGQETIGEVTLTAKYLVDGNPVAEKPYTLNFNDAPLKPGFVKDFDFILKGYPSIWMVDNGNGYEHNYGSTCSPPYEVVKSVRGSNMDVLFLDVTNAEST